MKTKLIIIIALPEHFQMLEIHIVHLVQMGLIHMKLQLHALIALEDIIQMNINRVVILVHPEHIQKKEI